MAEWKHGWGNLGKVLKLNSQEFFFKLLFQTNFRKTAYGEKITERLILSYLQNGVDLNRNFKNTTWSGKQLYMCCFFVYHCFNICSFDARALTSSRIFLVVMKTTTV